jgi:hypothetical protein
MSHRHLSGRVIRVASCVLLSLASMGAAGTAFLLGASNAAASPATATASVTVPYSCNVAGLLTEVLDIELTATAPAAVAPGASFSLSDLQTTTELSPTFIGQIFTIDPKAKDAGGTVVQFWVDASNATPSQLNAAAKSYSFDVPIKKGQKTPADVVVPPTPETVGPFTAGSSGTVGITPGNVLIDTTISGSKATVTCTAPKTFSTAETLSIAISSSASTVPTSSTGEPWANGMYWLLAALTGALGFVLLQSAVTIRRRRA